MVKQIFVNLPVKDLKRSKAFFSAMGFKFDRRFEDKNATCLILGKNMFAMLLVWKFFKSFNKKGACNAKKDIETITALQVASKKEVDALTGKALRAGAKRTRKAYDYGWMYGESIEDLDGHIWEFFFMDVKGMIESQKKGKKR
jgi:predicted lactoylglutathione lyase